MRTICLLGPAYPFRGGLASYFERLAREYQKQGDRVIIYTFTLQYPGFLFPGKTQYSTSSKPADLDIRVKVNSINPLNWWRVGRELKKLKPDLLLIKYWLPFMGPCFGTIARIAKKNKHTRVISILDNVIPHEKRLGDRAFTKYFLGAVDGFIAQSKSVAADLRTFDQEKPLEMQAHPLFDNFGAILPRETVLEKLGLDPKYRYLLFFGFIRDYKGLDLLIKAMTDERLKELPIRVIVAGEYYSNRAEFEKLIDETGVGDRLDLFNDFIPDEEVATYFSAADLVVQPYKHATQSGVTQIAYHFEKPMIVTNVGGLPEIVPHGKAGYVVEPEPKAIADAIVDFMSQVDHVALIEGVKGEKAKYGWDQMVLRIDEVDRQVMASRGQ